MISSFKQYLGTTKTWQAGGRHWTPVDVCAELLTQIVHLVERSPAGKGALREAVFAIPVGFTSAKRRDLRKAAQQAGIEVVQFVAEPTAAVLELSAGIKGLRKAAVFDWGGGTLDISVVAVEGGMVVEQEVAGMDRAGDSIDWKLAEAVHRFVAVQKGADVAFDRMPSSALDRLRVAAEKTKCKLSQESESRLTVTDYGSLGHFSTQVKATVFSSIIAEMIRDAHQLLVDTIRKRYRNPLDLDRVFMIGGSSMLPQIQERLLKSKDIGARCCLPQDAAWCVARGAARLALNPGAHLLAEDVGLIGPDGEFFTLLEASTPVSEEELCRRFGLTEDAQLASFVFGIRRHEDGSMTGSTQPLPPQLLDELSVECFGFCNEPIELRLGFDPDLVLHARARSLNKTVAAEREKLFEKLRFSYQLP
ncbi:MAG: Hsp70 family protein [Candidatus Riflebacteria bacterium]|nr:Hsp70 family protein [Candidatus Riflebacteria bacterium]